MNFKLSNRDLKTILMLLMCSSIYLLLFRQRDVLVFLHIFRACYVNKRTLVKRNSVLSVMESPRIYFPFPKQHALIFRDKYPGTPLIHALPSLTPAVNWFRIHHEYLAPQYMMHRLYHDHRLSTNNLSEADLCFPSCHAVPLDTASSNSLHIHVKPGSESKFMGCTMLTIGIDILLSRCSFNVPYWHSIYYPETFDVAPWELNPTKNSLLCFVGGVSRGYHRDQVLHGLRIAGSKFFSDFTKNTSGEWTLSDPPYEQIWEKYANCVFSWQPEGDTETRRGFYDSWMMGCIPVISRSAACTYAGLHGGTLFAFPGPALEDVVVVLEDSAMMDATAILGHLINMSQDEIDRRRKRMADMAVLMQWGWSETRRHSDALLEALSVFKQ